MSTFSTTSFSPLFVRIYGPTLLLYLGTGLALLVGRKLLRRSGTARTAGLALVAVASAPFLHVAFLTLRAEVLNASEKSVERYDKPAAGRELLVRDASDTPGTAFRELQILITTGLMDAIYYARADDPPRQVVRLERDGSCLLDTMRLSSSDDERVLRAANAYFFCPKTKSVANEAKYDFLLTIKGGRFGAGYLPPREALTHYGNMFELREGETARVIAKLDDRIER